MSPDTQRPRLLLALSVAGVLFAGYLSSLKFFTDTCALNESCPYFLGYPTCYYGFAMYAVMTILMVQYFLGGLTKRTMLNAVRVVSGLGILFAGYFTFGEIPGIYSGGFSAYVLGLPSCAYGLLVYIAIFFIAHATSREG